MFAHLASLDKRYKLLSFNGKDATCTKSSSLILLELLG